MTIERSELETIFNSPDNEIEDERVKDYDERSNKSNEYLNDLEKEINSQEGPSFLDKALEDNKKNKKEDMNEEITLNDLQGSEDMNFQEEKEDKIASKNIDFNDGKNKQETVKGRIPFEIDFDEDDEAETETESRILSENNKEDMKEDKKLKKEKPIERNKEVKELLDEDGVEDEELLDEDGVEDEESLDEGGTGSWAFGNVDGENNKEDISSVCSDKKYLEDPRYREFYNQKAFAVNFLNKNVPNLDYETLRKEIMDFHVAVNTDGITSLDEFNEKIQQVQASRNRLTKIKSLCIHSYVPRKRIVKLLEDCLMKESLEKSSDKRSGEIQIHMADLEYDLALAETFLKDVDQIMDNITSAHEALSRQITVLQERNKEIQRGEEPYVDSTSDDMDSIIRKESGKYNDSSDLVKITNDWKKI